MKSKVIKSISKRRNPIPEYWRKQQLFAAKVSRRLLVISSYEFKAIKINLYLSNYLTEVFLEL